PSKSFQLRTVAKKLATMLVKLIEVNVKSVTATSFASKFFDSFRENENALAEYGIHMIRRLSETGMSTYDIAFSQIMPTACAMIPNQSQVFTQIMHYYRSDEGIKHLPEIKRLAKINNEDSDNNFPGYRNEDIRRNVTLGSCRGSETSRTFNDSGKQV